MRIRLGAEEDLLRCQGIERAAGEVFRPWDMAAVADDAPPSLEELRRFVENESLWVAAVTDESRRPQAPGHGAEAAGSPPADPADRATWSTAPLSAYLLAAPVDGCTHIEQVSVHPAYAGHRIGARLIDHAAAAGADRPLTLTTFANVPWNAPYYQRLGFRTLTQAEVTPGLGEIREHERRMGLDRWPRVCMRREADPLTRWDDHVVSGSCEHHPMDTKSARGASEMADTEHAEAVVSRLWERMQDRDWAGLGALLSPEAVVDWPVSRERIHGRENYVAVQSEYPQGWSINVLRIVGGGEEAASEVEVPLEGVGVFRVASFWRLSQGLLVSGTEYWSGPEHAPSPAWRAPFVERY